jgi:hypothetical protein
MKAILAAICGLCLFTGIPVQGAIFLQAENAGGSANVTIGVYNDYGGAYSSFIVKRQSIGLCEDPIVVSPSPILLPPEASGPYTESENWEHYALTFPLPYPNVNFEYRVYLLDESGGETPAVGTTLGGMPVIPLDYVSNGPAPIMRGTLNCIPSWSYGGSTFYDIYVSPCEEGCWETSGFMLIASAVSTESVYFQNCNQGPVDLIGVPFRPDGMLYEYVAYTISDIVAAPNGECGPVPNESISWDSLKARFR